MAPAVPTIEQSWVDDGFNVFGLLRVAFDQNAEGSLASANTTEAIAYVSAWAAYWRQ